MADLLMRRRRWRVVNAEPSDYVPEALALLTDIAEIVEAPSDRGELLAALDGADALIVRLSHQIDREVIDAAGSSLRVIVTATTGLDHIDCSYASSRGVTVLSLKGEREFLDTIKATAEHTWALLLAVRRHLPAAVDSVVGGGWTRDAFKGSELNGRTLGLLGLGRIGTQVAAYGIAFGMTVVAYDPKVTTGAAGVRMVPSLRELLGQAEVLSVHAPLEPGTVNLLGADELDCLPLGATIVNTARGDLIDEAALLARLANGRIAAAALDVVAGERERSGPSAALLTYIRTHTNLIATPHIGGATFESMARTEVFMAKRLRQFLVDTARPSGCE